MGTFNLSLVASKAPLSDVQATTKLETVTDPNTDQPVEQTITKDGITIDKSMAPRLVIDAPIGHMYTELLNKELSIESMGAIIAAAEDDSVRPTHTGNVAIGSQGPLMETNDGNSGYIYIVDADTLESSALGEIASKFLDRKTANPSQKLGLAMISNGRPTSTVESLTRVVKGCGVDVAYTPEGLVTMACRMLGTK